MDYYGARVLSEPPVSGINWLVYVVPPVVFLIGVFLLFQAFRTWRKAGKESAVVDGQTISPGPGSAPANGTEKTDGDEEYVARLEEELKNRK